MISLALRPGIHKLNNDRNEIPWHASPRDEGVHGHGLFALLFRFHI